MKKKKRIVALVCFFAILFSMTGVALAQAGSFGHSASYYTECLVRLVPILNDIVKGYTGAATIYAPDIDNYAYIRVRIGASSANYTQNSKYKYNDDFTGTIQAGWTNSYWAQTYHLAEEFHNGWTDSITFSYKPR